MGSSGVLLLAAFVCTLILILGCVPASPGQPSILAGIYHVKMLVPSSHKPNLGKLPYEPDFDEVRVNPLAICSNVSGKMECVTTVGRTVDNITGWLYDYATPNMGNKPVEMALAAQGVFIPWPAAVLACVSIAPVFSTIAQCSSTRIAAPLNLCAICFAAFASGFAGIDLVASDSGLSGLRTANGVGVFTFHSGKAYIYIQMAVGILCLIASLDLLGSYARAKKAAVAQKERRNWVGLRSWSERDRPMIPLDSP